MLERQIFSVAGHRFALSMPADSPLWQRLTQYEPFRTEDGGDCLFELELVPSLVPGPMTVLYDAPVEDGQTLLRLFSCGDGVLAEMTPDHRKPICGRLMMSKDFKRASLVFTTASLSDNLFAVNNSLMLLFAFASSALNTLEMHASVILKDGQCYLFLGHSGAGKSTHSRQWLAGVPGSRLLNDDNPVVRVVDGKVIAFGSPWSGKTPCYRNEYGEAKAFVCIKQAPRNSMRRLSLAESYAALYSSSSGLKNNRKMIDGLHRTLAAVVTSVGCWEIECLPDTDAAQLCYSTINGEH